MLEKIMAFFERFFSFFTKNVKEKKTPNNDNTTSTPTPPTTDYPTIEEPIIEEPVELPLPEIVDIEEPQDAADITEEEKEDIVLINAELDKPIPPPPTQEAKPTTTTTTTPLPPKNHKPRYLWILDNGHGKKTSGKRSPKFPDGKQLFEYELNRAIVNNIITGLEKAGVKYHNLVPEENVGNILKTRVSRANSLRKKSSLPVIYVSVHSNAGPGTWTQASGIETWYHRTSLDGRKIAKIFQKHLIHKTKWVNRDVRTGMPFYVLKYTSMPAILTENGFFNNANKGAKLRTPETRQKLANAHIEAILEIEKYGINGMLG